MSTNKKKSIVGKVVLVIFIILLVVNFIWFRMERNNAWQSNNLKYGVGAFLSSEKEYFNKNKKYSEEIEMEQGPNVNDEFKLSVLNATDSTFIIKGYMLKGFQDIKKGDVFTIDQNGHVSTKNIALKKMLLFNP